MNHSREFVDGMAVLRACGNVPRDVYVELLEHMELMYPNRGWILQAEDLKRFYAEQDRIQNGTGEQFKFKLEEGK